MKTINKGFERLRQVVPYARDDRRHSKVETLRMAIEYIRKQFNSSSFQYKPCQSCFVGSTVGSTDHERPGDGPLAKIWLKTVE